jgi:glycosyltransferase involved in cell wall biosynthesis
MFFQMPAHMAHPPRPVRAEKFPSAAAQAAWPRLSIVTPSFQQGRFLEETMRSVLEQPGVSSQYVVQDGGSSDESRALIERHAGRLHAWDSARDHGQADAIARGFTKTSGGPDDVMAWINSDDFYQPGALAFVADYFSRHPEVDVVYGHRIVVDEASQEIARWFLPEHDDAVLRLNDFVPQETLFWRRRIWDKVGGLDTSFKFAMDWDLLLRFSAAGARIVRVPYFLACFRVHPTQKTSFSMHDTGQKEITLLRERALGRAFPVHELETSPVLLRYLRRSAWIQFLWKLGLRAS